MNHEGTYFTKIQKMGNSFGVIIPRAVADAHRFRRGDTVVLVHLDDETIAIRRLPQDFFIKRSAD